MTKSKYFVKKYYRKVLKYRNIRAQGNDIFLNKKQFPLNKSPESLHESTFKEKSIAFASYFTFGLAGIMYILVSLINGRKPAHYITYQTLNAIKLGVAIATGIFMLKVLMLATPCLIGFLQMYLQAFNSITALYPLFTLVITAIIAFKCVILRCSTNL